MLAALFLLLAGCAAGGVSQSAGHLSVEQCRDLAAIRNNAPPTPERNQSELAALRKAGYDPSKWFDPHYPEDLQAAQRQVDRWFQAECQQVPPA
jgi:predicted outer membrane protein